MDVRITQQSTVNQAIRNAQLRLRDIANLQSQLASGLRVQKPSDDPSVFGTLLANKASNVRMDVDISNISSARQKLNHSVSQLTEAGNLLVRAREIGLDGVQSLERKILGEEVDAMIDAMLGIANARDGGLQLYGGSESQQEAFEVTSRDPNGRPTQVTYFGATVMSQVLVAPRTPVETLYSGATIFQQSHRKTTEFLGITGATAGTGTDNGTGQGMLTVRHTQTTYVGTSGIAAGVSSAAQDTIIGSIGTHRLSIENDPKLGPVVRLNGGGPIPFDNSSVDLKVVGPSGEAVFVDLSGLAGGFTGTIDIVADGTLSVDGGLSETNIDFSQNQTLIHSEHGTATNVDSSGIRRAGTDAIEYIGTSGVFESLIQLRDTLLKSDGLSTTQYDKLMGIRIADVERAHDQVMGIVGQQSVELANLDVLESRTREIQVLTRESIIESENADIPDVVTELQNQQNLLQFIYASTANVFQVDLLDFIR